MRFANLQFAIRELQIIKGSNMKVHNGMRPQDIVILLKIAISPKEWLAKDLSYSLKISQSEISESLNRSAKAGLLSADKRILMKNSLIEFLVYGIKYVFPQQPGALVRGLPTAHSAPPLQGLVSASDVYVWPYIEGKSRGLSIEPLYRTVPHVCSHDRDIYELLSLTDALRVGKVREQALAVSELKKRIK
jgi:hypothetical protein